MGLFGGVVSLFGEFSYEPVLHLELRIHFREGQLRISQRLPVLTNNRVVKQLSILGIQNGLQCINSRTNPLRFRHE